MYWHPTGIRRQNPKSENIKKTCKLCNFSKSLHIQVIFSPEEPEKKALQVIPTIT